MTAMQRKIVVYGLSVIFLVVLGTTLVSTIIRSGAEVGDFWALYEASRHAIETGSLDAKSLGYYPPSGRPILMMLALLPAQPAAVLWWGISVGLQILCLVLIFKHLLPERPSDPLLLGFLAYLAMLPWVVSDLSGGNISTLILASLVISYYLYRKKWLWTSGLVLGVGIAVKFLPVFLIFFYAVKRRWKMAVISSLCTLFIGLVPGVVLFGKNNFFESWNTWSKTALGRRTVTYMILESPGISYINQSLANVFLHTLSPVSAGHHGKPFYVNIADLSRPTVLKIWMGIVLITGLAWVYLIWPGKNDPPFLEPLHFAYVCLPMIWFSPHVMSYYMTILLPAVTVLVWAAVEPNELITPVRKKAGWMILAYFLACVGIAIPHARAYGNYLLIILILGAGVTLIFQQVRQEYISKKKDVSG
jgi:hypothetical protein